MKKTVSQKSAAKIGLMGACSIIIASVVGVGIFFKNGGVFNNNNYNTVGVLLSWGLATVIALFTAFSYAEIVTVKGLKNANAGLAGWGAQLSGYNFGRMISITQSTFYYTAKLVAMGIMASVAIFQCVLAPLGHTKFDASLIGLNSNMTATISVIGGLVLVILFMSLNYFTAKFNSSYAKIATISKFLPIGMIIIIGLACGILAGKNLWTGWQYIGSGRFPYIEIDPTSDSLEMGGVLKSIPAILFAYDSFLVIGNVSNRIEEPNKNVPKAIVYSMIIAAVAQIGITIGEITIGTGSPYLVLYAALGGKTAGNWAYMLCVVILSVSIVIAACGVLNGLSGSGIAATQVLVDEKSIFGYQLVQKSKYKGNGNFGGFVIFGGFVLLIWTAIAIPSCILNTSNIYDGFSTLAVLFYFGIYGTVILGGLTNRISKKHEIHKVGYFVPFGVIAVVGCYFTFAYCVFYQFSTQVLFNPLGRDANSFGFAMVQEGYNKGKGLCNWQAACVFWSAAIFFLGYPFVNDLLIKLFDKRNPNQLIWEKTVKKSLSIQTRAK